MPIVVFEYSTVTKTIWNSMTSLRLIGTGSQRNPDLIIKKEEKGEPYEITMEVFYRSARVQPDSAGNSHLDQP